MKRILLLFGLLSLSSAELLWAAPDIQLLGPFGGDVRSLAIHPLLPDRVFLGTADGQIFFSVDAGDSWTRLVPGLARRELVIDNFAFHPTDANLIYAASWELGRNQGWLARSQDGGASWETVPAEDISSQIRAIAIAPSEPNVLALGVSEGVLLSRDGGRSWSNVTRGYRGLENIESLAFDPLDSKILYAGTWRLGWKTIDQGRRWSAIHEGMHFDSDMFSIVVNPLQTEVLYASACTGVYKSVNGGQRWSRVRSGIPKDAHRTRSLHLDPSDPETLYAGTTEGLFASRDGGAGWSLLIPKVVVNSVAVSPRDPQLVLVGTDDAGVLKSSDGGQSFVPSNRGFIHRQVGAMALSRDGSDQILVGLAQDGPHGGLFVSSNGGVNWESHNEGLGQAAASIRDILASRRSARVFLATASGVFSGILAGEPWTRLEGTESLAVNHLEFSSGSERGLLLATEQGLFRFDLESRGLAQIEPFTGAGPIHHLFLLDSGDTLFVSADSGAYRFHPEGGGEPADAGLPPGPVNFVKRKGNRLFAGTRQGLFRSDDGGHAWVQSKSVFPLDMIDLTSDPNDPSHLVATESTGGYLFESVDGGETWRAYPRENRSKITRLAFTAQGALLAATLSEGVYRVFMPVHSGD